MSQLGTMRGPLWLATAALLCCAFIAPAASQTLSASASVQVRAQPN